MLLESLNTSLNKLYMYLLENIFIKQNFALFVECKNLVCKIKLSMCVCVCVGVKLNPLCEFIIS